MLNNTLIIDANKAICAQNNQILNVSDKQNTEQNNALILDKTITEATMIDTKKNTPQSLELLPDISGAKPITAFNNVTKELEEKQQLQNQESINNPEQHYYRNKEQRRDDAIKNTFNAGF